MHFTVFQLACMDFDYAKQYLCPIELIKYGVSDLSTRATPRIVRQYLIPGPPPFVIALSTSTWIFSSG